MAINTTTKTYTTRDRCFQIPRDDFDIINEIYATPGGFALDP